MSSDVFSKIRVEILQLYKLLEIYHALLERVKTQEPNEVELIALAGILHSFYSGFENIFKRIALDIDGQFRKTDSWHADLLENMVLPTAQRPAVISEKLKERLQFYLSFRHVFRSNYSYDLNWFKMKTLVLESKQILCLVENELNTFMSSNS